MLDELVFGICWYDDSSIFRLLDSLPREAQKIVVDGRFGFNPNKNELSQEALRGRVKLYPNTIIIDAPNLSEPEKRNKYLQTDKKYLFIIDSDEYIIVADWDKVFKFLENLKGGVHDIFFEMDEFGGIGCYPRLWIYPKYFKYHLCHNMWSDNRTGEFYKSGNTGGAQIPGILCGMNDKLRTPENLQNTVDYQIKMMEFEKPYRQKYREGDMSFV